MPTNYEIIREIVSIATDAIINSKDWDLSTILKKIKQVDSLFDLWIIQNPSEE